MTNTKTARTPYEYNHATLPVESTTNAINRGEKKELINSCTLVVYDAKSATARRKLYKEKGYVVSPEEALGFTTCIDARYYMGRSGSASVVYCSVWISAKDGRSFSGHGSAGGYGYHKESAAFDSAIRSAGIQLEASVSGCREGTVRKACFAIAKACGFGRLPQLFQ